MGLPRVTKRKPCQICGKPDYCGITPDGKLAICMRVRSDKPSKNGGWIHVLMDDGDFKPKRTPIIPPALSPAPPHRSAKEIDEVYFAFLYNLVLAESHQSDLEARGLSQADIFLHGYKSMPTQIFASKLSRRLSGAFDLRGVPGFYKFTDWHFRTYGVGGFLIPIRNAEHQIVGLQVRTDVGQTWSGENVPKYLMISSEGKPSGTSSGTPPHFAALGIFAINSTVESIIITEGALKANIIAKFTDEITVGLVGVGCFDESFPLRLKNAFPNLRTCKIAFDMDAATNEAVKMQRDRLVLTLEKINLETLILSWNRSHKGFDDFLLAESRRQKSAA